MTDASGIDLHPPRSVREILLATVALYRRYPLLFVSLAVGLITAYELAVLLIAGYGPLAQHTHRSLQARIVLELLSFSLIGPLISALHVHAVISIGEGHRPRLIDVAPPGLRGLPGVDAACGCCRSSPRPRSSRTSESWLEPTPWPSRGSSSRCAGRWSLKRPQ